MRGGVILIILALLIGYLAVTGGYKCFSIFFTCIADGPGACSCGVSPTSDKQIKSGGSIPVVGSLPPLEAIPV